MVHRRVVGLIGLALLLAAPVTSRAADTAPVRVWTPGPLVSVFKEADYTARADTAPTIRLVSPRGGAASGQAVVCAGAALQIKTAVMSDLAAKAGDGVIRAAAGHVRYAQPTGSHRYARTLVPTIRRATRFDALAESPGPAATVQPVWLTVTVPADAVPGAYTGRLVVTPADAGSITVPVRLTVCSWALPAPKDFATHLGFIQSPDSLALQYKAPLWSKRHWNLVAQSFRFLGQLGNKTLYVPLIANVHFGNEESMVRWVRQPDGSFSHDFTVFERYVDLCIEHAVMPDVVCLYVWDYSIGGAWWGDQSKRQTPKPVPVSLLDRATGKVSLLHGPVHGAPESAAFWKPVMAGVRARLNERGISDDHIFLGVAGDKRPDKETAELFKAVAPYATWVSHSHGRVRSIHGVPVGYMTNVWGVGNVPPLEKERRYGWKRPDRVTVFPRYGGGKFVIHPHLSLDTPLPVYRNICEGATLVGLRGVGRLGADFWAVIPGKRGRSDRILNRYPDARWGQLTVANACPEILGPGPDGPVATIRFEMLREGLYEAEARIAIERALTTAALRARLGDALAGRCQTLLDDRTRAYLKAHGNLKTAPETCRDFAESDWQTATAALFNAAGEVAKALGSK